MISTLELAAQRIITDAFIDADFLMVSLVRHTKVSNGSGGFTTTKMTLAPQKVRMVPLQDATGERQSEDGTLVKPSYMLVCRYDVNLERWDQFTVSGLRYKVVFIQQNRQYQVKGEVAYLG